MSRWLVSRFKDPVRFMFVHYCAGAGVEVLGTVEAPTRGSAISAAAVEFPDKVRADNVFVDPCPDDLPPPPQPAKMRKEKDGRPALVATLASAPEVTDPYADPLPMQRDPRL